MHCSTKTNSSLTDSLTAFNETPLHIAAMRGHLQFATVVLTQKPKLAMALDSQRRTPLHLAAATGNLEMVQELIRLGSDNVCGFQDQDGLTPLHLAAMNEHLEVLKTLIQANRQAAKQIPATGETILHMCINYNRSESLKVIMELWNEDDLAKITDHGGNTLLHAAAINKQIQILNYLLMIPSVKGNGNAVNSHGLTAVDVLDQCPRDLKGLETQQILMESGVLRAHGLRPLPKPLQPSENFSQSKRKGLISRTWGRYLNDDKQWLEKQRGILILAALVVAAMSFHSGINPPGGTITNTQNGRYELGNAVQTEVDMDMFNGFVAYNTFTMIISLGIAVVLISGLSYEEQVVDVGAYNWDAVHGGVHGGDLSAVAGDDGARWVCGCGECLDLFDFAVGLWGHGVDSYHFFRCLGGDEAVKAEDAGERSNKKPECS